MGAKTLPFLAASPGRTTAVATASSQSATTSSAADRVVYVYSDKIEVRSQQVNFPSQQQQQSKIFRDKPKQLTH